MTVLSHQSFDGESQVGDIPLWESSWRHALALQALLNSARQWLSAFNDSLSKALEANRDDGRCDSDKLLCSEGSTGPRKQPTVFCPRAFHDIFFLWRLLILNRLFRSLVLFVLRVV